MDIDMTYDEFVKRFEHDEIMEFLAWWSKNKKLKFGRAIIDYGFTKFLKGVVIAVIVTTVVLLLRN